MACLYRIEIIQRGWTRGVINQIPTRQTLLGRGPKLHLRKPAFYVTCIFSYVVCTDSFGKFLIVSKIIIIRSNYILIIFVKIPFVLRQLQSHRLYGSFCSMEKRDYNIRWSLTGRICKYLFITMNDFILVYMTARNPRWTYSLIYCLNLSYYITQECSR